MADLVARPWFRPIGGLLVFAAAVTAVAVVGSLAAMSAGAEYQALRLPSWAPPSWLFGPMWTVLYGAIAVAGWLVWRAHGVGGARRELGLFAVQLVLNAAWTPLFFAAGQFELALLDIVALLVVVAVLAVWFFRKHRVAGLLLIPYLAWVGFATALTVSIVVLN